MHIPDGFLSNEVAVACAVPASACVTYGLRRAEADLDIGGLISGSLMVRARQLLPKTRPMLLAIVGVGAWLSVIAGAIACSFELAASGTVPLGKVLPAMAGVHMLIGFGESVISVAAVSAVLATRPDLVYGPIPELAAVVARPVG